MTDPYKILEITRDASDEEVKKAYRQMARKYHPDKNPGNQAAEEMFIVVQEAYEQIMNERKNGGSSPGGPYTRESATSGSYTYGGNYSQGPAAAQSDGDTQRFGAAANYIMNGYYHEGMNVLNNISERNALWHYLRSQANAGLGNNFAAVQDARTAVQMEPQNFMYQRYLQELQFGSRNYQNRSQSMYVSRSPGCCDCCTQICAAELCMELCCEASCCC